MPLFLNEKPYKFTTFDQFKKHLSNLAPPKLISSVAQQSADIKEDTVVCLQREFLVTDLQACPKKKFIGTTELETCVTLYLYDQHGKVYFAHVDEVTAKIDPQEITTLFAGKDAEITLAIVGGTKTRVKLHEKTERALNTIFTLLKALNSTQLNIHLSAAMIREAKQITSNPEMILVVATGEVCFLPPNSLEDRKDYYQFRYLRGYQPEETTMHFCFDGNDSNFVARLIRLKPDLAVKFHALGTQNGITQLVATGSFDLAAAKKFVECLEFQFQHYEDYVFIYQLREALKPYLENGNKACQPNSPEAKFVQLLNIIPPITGGAARVMSICESHIGAQAQSLAPLTQEIKRFFAQFETDVHKKATLLNSYNPQIRPGM